VTTTIDPLLDLFLRSKGEKKIFLAEESLDPAIETGKKLFCKNAERWKS